MSKVTVIAIGTALLLVSVAAAAETYRWVDSDGSVHYGDRAVRGSQQVDIRVAGESPAPPDSFPPIAEYGEGTEPAEGEAQAGATEEGAQVRAQLCDQARERLAKYEKADGIYEEGPDGQQRKLTLDERVDTILKARQTTAELCAPPTTSELAP